MHYNQPTRLSFLAVTLLISICCAAITPVTLYTNGVNGNAKSAAVVNNQCARNTGIMILTDSTTTCITYVSNTGAANATFCPVELQGATSLSCIGASPYWGGVPTGYKSYCFAANPVTNNVVVFTLSPDGTSLTVRGQFGATTNQLTAPNYLTVYTYAGTAASVLVTSFTGTQIIVHRFIYDFSDGSNSITLITQTPSTTPTAGIYTHPNYFIFAAVGADKWLVYSYTGTVVTTSSFGAPSLTYIDTLSGDYLYNLYVGTTVAGVSTIKSFAGATLLDTWALAHPAMRVTHAIDTSFVIDTTGALIANKDPLAFVSYSASNATCTTGSISTTVTGGSMPYQFILNPSWSTLSQKYAASHTFTTVGLSNTEPVTEAYLYNNGKLLLHLSMASSSTSTVTENRLSTAVVRSGKQYSYSIITNIGGFSYWWCTTCVNAIYYQTVEMWINVGDGGQYFSVEVHGAEVRSFRPGDFPTQTWVKLTFDYSSYPYINYGFFRVMDTRTSGSGPQNAIYIDSIKLIPYTDMNPRVRVRDACGLEVSTPYFTITDDNALKVSTNKPQVTCSPESYDDALSSDATLTATAVGGVPPYSYAWTMDPATTSEITNQPSMRARMLVYDNQMNAADGWVSSNYYSTTIIEQDTTYYRSPPYSYSFAPSKYFDGLYFYHDSMPIADWYAYEFWVNGGPNGRQYMTAVVDSDSPYGVQALEAFTNQPFIPPNKWIKVILPIPTFTQSSTFFGMQVAGARDGLQDRIYIDDMYLIASHAAVVTDSIGCVVYDRNIDIAAPPVVTIEVELDYIKCFNTSTGGIYVTAGGGTPPYQYNWTLDGSDVVVPLSNPNVTNLPELFAHVTIIDSKGCHSPYAYNTALDGPPVLEVFTKSTNAVCAGGFGTLVANSKGGNGPYTYKWSSTSGSAFNATLQPDPFPIFIDDLSKPFTLFGSYAVFFQGTHVGIVQSLPVHYTHSGYRSIAAVPYDIGNGAPYYNFTVPGQYISLSLGCLNCIDLTIWKGVSLWFACDPAVIANMSMWLIKGNVSISPPLYFKDVPSLNFTGNPVWQNVFFPFHNDTATKADTILVMSSAPIPVALYDDIVLMATKESARSVVVGKQVTIGYNATVLASAGNYTVEVTDNSGCPKLMKFTVTEPSRVTIEPWIFNNGSASLNVSGGSPPYTYNWVGLNTTTKYIAGVATGIYTVEVTDSYGCMSSVSVNIPVTYTVREYNKNLSSGLGALVAAGFVVAVFSILMLVKFWAAFSALGSFYCAVLLVGVLISYAAALVLLPRPTDALCTAFPWLLGIAFSLVYGCLFIKTWGLYRVWANAKQYKKTNLTPLYIVKVEAVVVLSEIVLMAIWTAVDPPRVKKVEVLANEYELQCNTEHPTFWIIFLLVKGVWLVFGAILSVLTRDVIKKYNESSSISYAIYNITVLCAIGVPLGILLEKVPGGRLVIQVIITVLAFTFTMVIMFFKSWYNALSDRSGEFSMGNYLGKNTHQTGTTTHSGNSGSAVSYSSSGRTSARGNTISPAVSFGSSSAGEPLKVVPL